MFSSSSLHPSSRLRDIIPHRINGHPSDNDTSNHHPDNSHTLAQTIRAQFPHLLTRFFDAPQTGPRLSSLTPLRELLCYPKPLRLPTCQLVSDSEYLNNCFATLPFLLVEVLSVIDISQPINRQRNGGGKIAEAPLSTDEALNDEFLESCDQDRLKHGTASRKRLVKVLMSDGNRFIVGIEYHEIAFLESLLRYQRESTEQRRKERKGSTGVLGRAILYNAPQCVDGIVLLEESNIRLLSSAVQNTLLPTFQMPPRTDFNPALHISSNTPSIPQPQPQPNAVLQHSSTSMFPQSSNALQQSTSASNLLVALTHTLNDPSSLVSHPPSSRLLQSPPILPIASPQISSLPSLQTTLHSTTHTARSYPPSLSSTLQPSPPIRDHYFNSNQEIYRNNFGETTPSTAPNILSGRSQDSFSRTLDNSIPQSPSEAAALRVNVVPSSLSPYTTRSFKADTNGAISPFAPPSNPAPQLTSNSNFDDLLEGIDDSLVQDNQPHTFPSPELFEKPTPFVSAPSPTIRDGPEAKSSNLTHNSDELLTFFGLRPDGAKQPAKGPQSEAFMEGQRRDQLNVLRADRPTIPPHQQPPTTPLGATQLTNNAPAPVQFYGMCTNSICLGPVATPHSGTPLNGHAKHTWPSHPLSASDGYIDIRPSQLSADLWDKRQVPLPSDQLWVVETISTEHQRSFRLLVRVREEESKCETSGQNSNLSRRKVVIDIDDDKNENLRTTIRKTVLSTSSIGNPSTPSSTIDSSSSGTSSRNNPVPLYRNISLASLPQFLIHYEPNILVFSDPNFNMMHRQSSGLFLVHLFNRSSKCVNSILLGVDIPLIVPIIHNGTVNEKMNGSSNVSSPNNVPVSAILSPHGRDSHNTNLTSHQTLESTSDLSLDGEIISWSPKSTTWLNAR